MKVLNVKKIGTRIYVDSFVRVLIAQQIACFCDEIRDFQGRLVYSEQYKPGFFEVMNEMIFYPEIIESKKKANLASSRGKIFYHLFKNERMFSPQVFDHEHATSGIFGARIGKDQLLREANMTESFLDSQVETFALDPWVEFKDLRYRDSMHQKSLNNYMLEETGIEDQDLQSVDEFVSFCWRINSRETIDGKRPQEYKYVHWGVQLTSKPEQSPIFVYRNSMRLENQLTLKPIAPRPINSERCFLIEKPSASKAIGKNKERISFLANPIEEGFYFSQNTNDNIKIHKTKIYLALDGLSAIQRQEYLKDTGRDIQRVFSASDNGGVSNELPVESRIVYSISEGRTFLSSVADGKNSSKPFGLIQAKLLAKKANNNFSFDYYKVDECSINDIFIETKNKNGIPLKSMRLKLNNDKYSFTDIPMSVVNTFITPIIRRTDNVDVWAGGHIQGLLPLAYASQKMYEKFGCSYFLEITSQDTPDDSSQRKVFDVRIMPSWALTDKSLFKQDKTLHAPMLTCTLEVGSDSSWSDIETYMTLYGVDRYKDYGIDPDLGIVKGFRPGVVSFVSGDLFISDYSEILSENFLSGIDFKQDFGSFFKAFDYYLKDLDEKLDI